MNTSPYQSPLGDLLFVDAAPPGARLICHQHVARFQLDPALAPVLPITYRLHVTTLAMAVEAGLAFGVIEIVLLPPRPKPIWPVIRLTMGGILTAYLVPLDLMFSECWTLFSRDRELSLIVCVSYSLPRDDSLLPTAMRVMTANRRNRNQPEDAR